MKNIAIIVKNKQQMEQISEISNMNGYNTSNIMYPVIATLQHNTNEMVLIGTHSMNEREFLESAGYIILSFDNRKK